VSRLFHKILLKLPMEDKLAKLGFTHKEARIYLALLELGKGTISEISRKSNVNRTSVYDNIGGLVEIGLINKIRGTKKDTFSAEPPEKLPVVIEKRKRLMEARLNLAKSMVGELKLISSKQPGKPRVSMYDGEDGVKALYEDSLTSTETIRSFSSADSLEQFDVKYLHDYYKRRAKKKIFITAILNDTPVSREYQAEDSKLCREIRLVPREAMDIRPEVYVYDNKVAFFSIQEKFGVLLESYDVAKAIKKIFDLAWKEAGRKK